MAVCAFVILLLSLLAMLFMLYFKRELKQTISTQQMTLMRLVAQDVDDKLINTQQAIVAAAARINTPLTPDADFKRLQGIETLFDNGLYLLSPQGRVLAQSVGRFDLLGRDLSFREYFRRTLETGKPVISSPFLPVVAPNVPVVAFTAPVRDKSGRLVAVLSGGVSLLRPNFLGELATTRIGTSGYLFLFSPERFVIMHPDQTRIMADKVPPGANKLLDRALKGFEGGEENVNSRGMHALSFFKKLKTTDWVLGANIPLSEVYQPIYRAEKYCIGAVLTSALLSILVIRLMMGSFTEALVQFARHVKEISLKNGADRLFRLDSRDEIGLLAKTFNSMIQEYDRKSEQLLHFSTHDALSGLYNRGFFDAEVKRLSAGRMAPVSVVLADIDDLKMFNDTHGHSVGDKLIKATAWILLEAFRAEDVVARIGGDEFAVLLPGLDAAQAEIAMKRVRSIADRCDSQEQDFPISISLGCSTAENPDDLEATIRHADQQMYLDKVSRKMTEKEAQL
ncbi:diguanylate cyclase [Geobacter sp. SVR]|nr:diguanylate cyclase [Geobacter sp. SVR]GCF83446.1 diguanylate cyclase [Geobacter sp. SVR]